jgi:O-antigen/teichoic acid export membrane protein
MSNLALAERPPAPVEAPDAQAAGLSMVRSSLGMIVGRGASMGLGFLFWLLAARLCDAAAVGLTAGATSAIMLCGQLALSGVGPAIVARYPDHRRDPSRLFNTAFTLASLAGVVVAVAFLILARGVFKELDVVAARPGFAALFLVMAVLGTLGYIFDLVSMALGRGDHVIVRNVANGLVTILPLGLVLSGFQPGSQELFGYWVGGAVCATLLGLLQFRRSARRYRFRPQIDRKLAPGLVREGLWNQVLTLGENAPGLLLAVIVTELLGPSANAYWYTVWMMAWAVFVIPISVGVALFSEGVGRPELLRGHVRRAMRSSLLLGVPAAIGVAVLARPVLTLLGSDYAAQGTGPLRILVLGVLPLVFLQSYYAICRSTGRLKEAVGTGLVTLALGITLACAGGRTHGLVGMAIGWIGVQYAAGLWSALRIRRILAAGPVDVTVPDAPELSRVAPVAV